MKIINFIIIFLTIALTAVVLTATIRGKAGNPQDYDLIRNADWTQNGPFELSTERGRFGLIYSIAENHSFTYSPFIAAFVAPDVGYIHNQFVSLFPPGPSYVAMAGYLIGRQYGFSQLGSFATIAVFALINVILVYWLSRRLGANSAASAIAALIFVFATPAFSYATTLYQHHITAFLLLVSLLLLSGVPRWWSLVLLWLTIAAALVVDSPNIIFLLPAAIYGFSYFWRIEKTDLHYSIGFKLPYLLTFVGAILPLAFLAHFNYQSYGNPLQLGGGVQRSTQVILSQNPLSGQVGVKPGLIETTAGGKKSPVAFFKTRNSPNGMYELTTAIDRGWLIFTPVMLFSVLGISYAARHNKALTALILATAGTIYVLYSLWGDPYGGWAFGPRYLIPVFAIMAPFVATALTKFRHNLAIMIIFIIYTVYSVGINTIGTLTSNMDPSDNELVAMQKSRGWAPPNGYFYNWQELRAGISKSYVYNTYFSSRIDLTRFALLTAGGISVFIVILMLASAVVPTTKGKNAS